MVDSVRIAGCWFLTNQSELYHWRSACHHPLISGGPNAWNQVTTPNESGNQVIARITWFVWLMILIDIITIIMIEAAY